MAGYKSYAYDPTGNKVETVIKDGQTYTAGGDRIGEGYTVETQGGIYKMQDGKGVKVDAHNTAPVQPQQPITQQPQQPSVEELLAQIMSANKSNSDAFYNSQASALGQNYSNYVSQLESSYADAIAQGKISERDAEAQFNAQTGQIEKQAYQQNEATKLNASDMGIQHSQQMVGLQAGDRQRTNSLHNTNATERDKRISDVRDRINALKTQKNLSIAEAGNQYGLGLAGARAQADQMYSNNAFNFASQNFFNQQGREWSVEDRDMGYEFQSGENQLNREHDFNLEEVRKNTSKELAEFQKGIDLEKMYVNHELNLEKMAQDLKDQFAIIDKNYSVSSRLKSEDHANIMSQIGARAVADAQAVENEYQTSKRRLALSLGLPENAGENEIRIKQRDLGREDALWEITTKREAGVQDSVALGLAQYEAEVALNNPDLQLDPKKPTSYSDAYSGIFSGLNSFGWLNDLLFNTKGKTEQYDTEEARRLDAIRKRDEYIKQNSIGGSTSVGREHGGKAGKSFKSRDNMTEWEIQNELNR